MGEVLRFHIADELFDDFKIDPDLLAGRSVAWAGRRTRA